MKNVTNPELYHVMRHCVDRNITSSAATDRESLLPSKSKRTMIPIKGYDDEEYARGCLQYYNEQFMVNDHHGDQCKAQSPLLFVSTLYI